MQSLESRLVINELRQGQWKVKGGVAVHLMILVGSGTDCVGRPDCVFPFPLPNGVQQLACRDVDAQDQAPRAKTAGVLLGANAM